VNGERRWKIFYHFSFHETRSTGYHTEEHKGKIRDSLKFIMEETCITFEELPVDNEPEEGVMRFIRGQGCYATLGKTKNGNNQNFECGCSSFYFHPRD